MHCQGVLVHDWIERTGGSEKVVDVLADMFPSASIYCLWSNDPDRYAPGRVRESWIARSPLRDRKAATLAVMSQTMRRTSLAEAEWALVSSHSMAHHFASNRGRRRIPVHVYAHTPPRYLWAPEVEPRGNSRPIRAIAPLFRQQDRRHAGGAPYAVNSAYVAERARRAWHLEPTVIFPPIEVKQASVLSHTQLQESAAETLSSLPDTFILGASRFVSYKRIDEVIRFGERVDLPVVIAGSGPDEGILRKAARDARVPVTFVGRPDDPLLYSLFSRALVFVFPPVEDFGMMPAEALAAGGRVIVNAVGGAQEILEVAGGGAVYDFEGSGRAKIALDEAIAATLPSLETMDSEFGVERFQQQIRNWMGLH